MTHGPTGPLVSRTWSSRDRHRAVVRSIGVLATAPQERHITEVTPFTIPFCASPRCCVSDESSQKGTCFAISGWRDTSISCHLVQVVLTPTDGRGPFSFLLCALQSDYCCGFCKILHDLALLSLLSMYEAAYAAKRRKCAASKVTGQHRRPSAVFPLALLCPRTAAIVLMQDHSSRSFTHRSVCVNGAGMGGSVASGRERRRNVCDAHQVYPQPVSLAAINMILSYCSALAVSLQSDTLSFALSHHFFL